MICICIIAAISCSHQQKTANRTAIIVKKTIVKCLNFHSKHRSVTDPAKPDPVDLFPSPNENLASPVSGEIFTEFYSVGMWLPRCDFYIPSAYHLKKSKQRPDRKGQPGGKFAYPVTFFSENPMRI